MFVLKKEQECDFFCSQTGRTKTARDSFYIAVGEHVIFKKQTNKPTNDSLRFQAYLEG